VGELAARFAGPVLDTGHNAVEMANFYASLLGWRVADQGPKGWWAIIRSPDDRLKIEFQGSPDYRRPVWPTEDDEQQMMMHLDIEVDDLEAAVARAIEAGGTEAPWQPPNRNPDRIRIVLDPAGHPVCLFVHGE
jgi:hypothetical protein